jgi:pimeloyl-ACP methyl ester carboxylesterase
VTNEATLAGCRFVGSLLVVVTAVWLPAGPTQSVGHAQSPDPAGQRCAALQSTGGFPNPTTMIASAVWNPPSEAKPAPNAFAPPVPALPAHCEVVGRLNERQGVNGQPYAITFRLRLPADWNNRFFFQGGGGSNGFVGDALGALQGQQPTVALALGYAVVSQDAGHDNMRNNDPARGATQTFGLDPQARIDYGYNSYDQVTQTSKALIAKYYGRAPQKSYFVGCSEGGREGMLVTQRFPDRFDGVLACSPGFRLPRAAVAEAWDSQAFAAVARRAGLVDANQQPFLNKTFTDEDLFIVSNAVLAACDGLDGLTDGQIDHFTACTTAAVEPKLAAITCTGEKAGTCVSHDQVAALKTVFGGARTTKGEAAYAPWAWDAGISGKVQGTYNQGWRIWKIGAFAAQANSAINLTLGALALPLIFVTPPVPVASTDGAPAAYALRFDIDAYGPALSRSDATYTQSALEFMKADSTDLSTFKKHGGRLLIVHGVSDPVFSILDTVDWWNEVNKRNRSRASDFIRLFAVPGMNHCGGGPATDQFDAFGALVAWVEKGVAPDRIVATARASTPWLGRTRPLCPYPQQAGYTGSGDINDARSFVCR